MKKIARPRRTKVQVEQLELQIVDILEEDHPQSVRHVFYRLTDPRLQEPVEKTESGYRQVVDRLVKMRRGGRIPYGWISDSTRLGYHVPTYRDPRDFLESTLGDYRLDEWEHAETHVEVWCESRSLAGVIQQTCEALGVSLFPCGGFSSDTFIYEAAMEIRGIGKSAMLLYVGDLDPAGVLIDVDILRKMRLHLPGHDVRLRRLAITEAQVLEFDLPTKPRKATERRRPDLHETVEAEAMPAHVIRRLVRAAVDSYLDPDVRLRVRRSERVQRETLSQLADRMPFINHGR